MTKKAVERLAVLETKLDTIENNHLAHINSAINDFRDEFKEFDKRFNRLIYFIIASTILGLMGKDAINYIKLLM